MHPLDLCQKTSHRNRHHISHKICQQWSLASQICFVFGPKGCCIGALAFYFQAMGMVEACGNKNMTIWPNFDYVKIGYFQGPPFIAEEVDYFSLTDQQSHSICLIRYFKWINETDTSRHQSAIRWKNVILIITKCYFEYQESRQDRPQGLRRDKYWTYKNLGLIAAECNGIMVCAYSLKKCTV